MASGGAICMNSFDVDAQCVSMGSQRYDGQVLDQQRLDSQVTMDALAGPRGSNIRTTSELGSSVRNTSSFENSYPSRPDRNNQPPVNSSDNRDVGSSGRDNPNPSAHYMDPMSVLSALQKAPAGTVYRCQWVNTNALIRRQVLLEDLDAAQRDLDALSLGSMSSLEETGFKPTSIFQAEVDVYFDELDPVLKVPYIDVLILYAEENREEAVKFRNHLITDIDIGEDGPVKAMLYDEAGLMSLSNSKLGHLAAALERSTFVFMYLTKEFTEDMWMELSSESCLMEAIENPKKKWCVVPVHTERRNATFKVPIGLNSLKGISYYINDKYYRQGLARLIGDKVKVRKRNNERLMLEQKVCIEKYKREQAIQRVKELKTKIDEEIQTENFIYAIQNETQRRFYTGVQVVSPPMSSLDPSSNPGQLHYSQSESYLKPARPQNPAVQQNIHQMIHSTSQDSETYLQRLNRVTSKQGMSTIGESSHIDPQCPEDSSQTMENSRNVQSYNAMALQVPSEIKECPPEQQEEFKQYNFKQMQEEMQRTGNEPNWQYLTVHSQELPSQTGPNSDVSQHSLHSNNGGVTYGDLRMFKNLISRISMDNDGRYSTVGVQHQMVNRPTQQLDPAEHHQGYSQPNQQQGYSQPNQQQVYCQPNHLDYSQLNQHEGYSQPDMPPQGQHQHIYSESDQTGWPAMEPNQAKVKCDKHGQIVHKTVNYTINVVGAEAVQIGDHNVAQNATQLPRDGDDDDVDDNDDEEEKETKMSAMESSGEQKMIPSKQSRLSEGETSSKLAVGGSSRGRQMSEESNSSGASCYVSAASSAHQPRPSRLEPSEKRTEEKQESWAETPMKDDNVLPVLDDSCREDHVNLKTDHSMLSQKSSQCQDIFWGDTVER